MGLINIGVSLIGAAIAFVSFVGICNALLMIKDPDPDKKRKSTSLFLWSMGSLTAGVVVLSHSEELARMLADISMAA